MKAYLCVGIIEKNKGNNLISPADKEVFMMNMNVIKWGVLAEHTHVFGITKVNG